MAGDGDRPERTDKPGKWAVRIRDLWFSYNGEPVLENVRLEIPQGAFVAVMGPNGSGKTTLLKLMVGILKTSRGEIRIFDRPPGSVPGLIGYVPQDTSVNKSFPVPVLDVVLMGRLGRGRLARRFSEADRETVRSCLEQVGMWKQRRRIVSELSGGERQRVLIARALAVRPRILFMDEPTASVDAVFQSELYELLKRLNHDMTIVVVSHDMSVLSSYVGSVACVNRSVFYHDAGEITAEMLDRVYHCPVELVAHGLPHRVLQKHGDR